jgi:predicted nucleic acid-binding protein
MSQSYPTPYPSRIFLDSSANLAVADRTDENHNAARSIYQNIVQFKPQIFTTNFITDESYTLILSNLGRQAAVEYLDRLYASSFSIVRISPSDERRAEELLRQFQDKNFSYTDASSFVVMDRLHITHAFAFDRNFAQYGKVVLAP